MWEHTIFEPSFNIKIIMRHRGIQLPFVCLVPLLILRGLIILLKLLAESRPSQCRIALPGATANRSVGTVDRPLPRMRLSSKDDPRHSLGPSCLLYSGSEKTILLLNVKAEIPPRSRRSRDHFGAGPSPYWVQRAET